MKEYLDLVENVLTTGVLKKNRTGVDTIATFAQHYSVDLSKGYSLLTTKKMQTKSLFHEFLWYLSGEEHIRNLQRHTKIWDAWQDKHGNLETSYGRYWRRFPVPEKGAVLDGELMAGEDHPCVRREANGALVFDQIRYVIDSIKVNPDSRRLVVSAWHPANAAISKLPACHYSFVLNVLDGKLNCHLTQRSGDIALGIPFNLAAYDLLTRTIAQQVGLEPGIFSHTIVDAHIYVNHIAGLKEQLKRTPKRLPTVTIAKKPLDDLRFEDFTLEGYECDEPIKFEVAV